MQFIKNGPDIPEALLEAHEEGRVVFFCGAGISTSAGLPGFGGLVKQIYNDIGVIPDSIQQAAIKSDQFDTALGLLEAVTVGGNSIVRESLAKILKPNLSNPSSLTTHESILTLATTRKDQVRLITTNFDRIFEEIINNKKLDINSFQAPLLPVPKKKWNGLVYLHGLLSSNPKPEELKQLVITSGDFGLAYLLERWAARFISELFRNYTVCFIGYSLNDPVLRYMMDALAADCLLGETAPEMFAFGSYSKNQKNIQEKEWKSKNVTPILYSQFKRHYYLHKTLIAWSKVYRDGLNGKEQIVTSLAIAKPIGSTQQDNFIGRMLWALCERNGLPAKLFSELNPVPDIDWLVPLSENYFDRSDLKRFGVSPNLNKHEKQKFSFIKRPASYEWAPLMNLVELGYTGTRLDNVMLQLAHWLLRHLNDPKLLLWVSNNGGQLHENFVRLIQGKIDELIKLEQKKEQEKINSIKENAPNAIPSPLMRILWGIVLSGGLKSLINNFDLYTWVQQFKLYGLTSSARVNLCKALSPKASFSAPFTLDAKETRPDKISDIVEWKIVLSSDYTHSAFNDLWDNLDWISVLPDLLLTFTQLLRDKCDLEKELQTGNENNFSGLSCIERPSISTHSQNKDYYDWTILIDLLRESWINTSKVDTDQAKRVAEIWWYSPYPIFQRLALFTASQQNIISNKNAVNWLLENNSKWLWSMEAQREVIRLLVFLAPRLDLDLVKELVASIIVGPNKDLGENIDQEEWDAISNRKIWLRLKKLQDAGANLKTEGLSKLAELTMLYPKWEIATDESDEFPFWSGVGSKLFNPVHVPTDKNELVEWLKEYPNSDYWNEDDWGQLCHEKFELISSALITLSEDNLWFVDRWRVALQIWSEDDMLQISWLHMAKIFVEMPEHIIKELLRNISWWIKAQAKTFKEQDLLFFKLVHIILDLEIESDTQLDNSDHILDAINASVGHATEAILIWWYRQQIEDNQGLEAEINTLFSKLCDTNIKKFRHGRAILSTHIIALFRVDTDWATKYLIPLFDWQKSEEEATLAWHGFLRSPRIYYPLLDAMKQQVLVTTEHYEQLGNYREVFAGHLTFISLNRGHIFTQKELRQATGKLPLEGLSIAVKTLVNALDGAGEKRDEYWENRILPYYKSIWPKSNNINTLQISESFAKLCISARDKFPDAFKTFKHWLQPLDFSNNVVYRLDEAKLSNLFPHIVLSFLDIIVDVGAQWPPSKLKDCLDSIKDVEPDLENDVRFQKLTQYLQQHGHG